MSTAIRSLILATVSAAALGGLAHAELPAEQTPSVATLPEKYPGSYVYVVDGNFWGIESGKVVIVDVADETRPNKGALGAAQFGHFAYAKTRPELYVAETFYERGHRGARTDVLTIYDKVSLKQIGEVVLPGGKRGQSLSEAGAFQLSADERFAFVYNFTPASSVTVVDLKTRKVAGEVDIPGCVHAFALKGGGFASLCGNGGVASTKLDANGRQSSQKMSQPFNDIDNAPMFTRPTVVGGVAYFPTYDGRIQPIDLNGAEAVAGAAWAIEPAAAAPTPAPAKKKSWRDRIPGLVKKAALGGKRLPSGWQLITSDDAGNLYVLMRATETMDDHDTGSDEVYVIDPKSRAIVNKLKLRAPSQAIEVTSGPTPFLVALNPDQSLDVLDAKTGAFVRRIGGQIVMSPFAIVANK